ncbi:amyloid beta A4 precursor protein-binding family B member 1-interacting protein-like, partial [Pipra filicauda]|uniref:Amyloid beta A4 precursor protein-binding family B member 1-interacting protein-like n=1 Tax=Pipra filicauda TaxID=649802 RepID=A0A6J2J686_9PASS
GRPPPPADRAGLAALPHVPPPAPLTRRPAGLRPLPPPRRSQRWRLPLPPPLGPVGITSPSSSPASRLAVSSSLQKSTHLLRRHREGRNWLPAAVQGTRPAAGERRAPPAPARQHGLGRWRVLRLPWAFSEGVHSGTSSDFPP